jgi:hypothetical protein
MATRSDLHTNHGKPEGARPDAHVNPGLWKLLAAAAAILVLLITAMELFNDGDNAMTIRNPAQQTVGQ